MKMVLADYPNHPDDTVLPGSEWNPKKITEIDVWNYYTGVKNNMLEELKGRDMFIGIVPKGFKSGKPVFVRHPYDKKSDYIHIEDAEDFEVYHSGRTVEYHITMPQMAPYYVVDYDSTGPFKETKKVVAEIADAMKGLDNVKEVEIRFTGKRGFHVIGWLKKAQDVNEARTFLHKWLVDTFEGRKDVVFGESPVGDRGALGLTCMKLHGGQIAKWSLRTTGLCCVEVPRPSLEGFEREDVSIDKAYKKATGRDFTFGKKEAMASRIACAYMNALSNDLLAEQGNAGEVRVINAAYDTKTFQSGYKGRFVVQFHTADKAGKHWDVRFEWPVKSLAKSLGTYGRKGRGHDEPSGEYPDEPGTVYRSFVNKKREIPSGNDKIFLVETEDHPIEYGKFQGEITEGYGKGTVEIFDHGHYELLSTGKGRYVVKIDGEKINGVFALVRYKNGFLWLKTKKQGKEASVLFRYLSQYI